MQLRFDRGTLVLGATDTEVAALQSPHFTWDPRVRVWRAPAFRHAEILAQARTRGVRILDGVRTPDAAPPVRPPELRPYQEDALVAWELQHRRGCVALPTGSGKTLVAVAAMARAR